MRALFPIFLSAVLGTVAATAKEFKLPADKPLINIEIEEAWKPDFIPHGLQAQPADGTVYLAVEATANAKEMSTIIDGSDAMLKTRKVTLDRSSRKDNKFKLNNFPAEELIYTGVDSNGPVTVSFTFVTLPGATVVFTYWASAAGHREHQPELGKIFDSIKPVRPIPAPTS